MPPRPSSDGRRSSAADVFRHDPGDGSLRLPGGRRLLAVSEAVIRSLHFSVVEALGDTASDILYRTGYEWALQDMLHLNRSMHDEFGGETFDFWEMDTRFVFDSWWSPLESAGWGSVALDLSAQPRGLTFVELRQGIVASALAGAEQPVCHLCAGLFAGALSFFERVERHAVEVQCRAMGHESCRFIVGGGAEIDSAEAWRQQGASASEIFRRLT